MKIRIFWNLSLALLLFLGPSVLPGQSSRAPKTPLPQKIMDILSNEISGQIIFNNEVILAGAPWIREREEFSKTLYESQRMLDIAKSYGIDTVRLDRFPRDREFDYPFAAEFWIVEPEHRLVARLQADAALVAGGSESADITGKLIYLPPLGKEEIKAWQEGGIQKEYADKIALMWSHPRGDEAKALDAAGIRGVVSFRAQDRYFDPDQVIYSRGSYSGLNNLKLGFTISWRQWSELLEDIERGRDVSVRCRTQIETFPDKMESVFAWIPGLEPDKRGLIFTGHLYEGYTKRGANDNMSGCVVQMEILRALSKLIKEGTLPHPRRTIYFLWPNEISGTYEHFAQHPGFAEKISVNINMDMVGEGLRKNNALFTMTECTNHLPSYLDGLGHSILNFVWRTNDIVYLPDSPRSRYGQVFPQPIWEKNGSRDAFRFDIHLATGGSDHTCFNNSSVAIPAIELNIWPDQWYHTDLDTPDKSDPTQLKRTAFIGAAMAWAVADCTDEVLENLLDAVSAFGYGRLAERELPQALKAIDSSDAGKLQIAMNLALNLISFACERETAAILSTRDIYSGSDKAQRLVDNRTKQWELYESGLKNQILEYSRLRAQELEATPPEKPGLSEQEEMYLQVVPSIHPDVRGRQFYLESTEGYKAFTEKNPDFIKELKLDRSAQRGILNFVNGRRSVTEIRNWVRAETGRDLEWDKLIRYLEFLKTISWITY
jgi:aminopeptidase YwaD